ncbi:MAG: mechanosensitive ion channel family protein [Candidatus Kapaibacterium sp.]
MQNFQSYLEQFIASVGPDLLTRLATTAGIVLAIWLLRYVILKLIFKKTVDVRSRYKWRKITLYVADSIGIFLIGRVWFEEFQSVITFLGLLSAGIAIALKDPLVNIAGWVFIFWRRPFEVGDRIQIGENAGDVIDQRMFQFTIMEIGNWVQADQYTGRIIHIPNSIVFAKEQAIYTKGSNYIWNEVGVLITFESNWKKAKEILTEIVEDHGSRMSETARESVMEATRQFMILNPNLEPSVYTDVRDSGVLLSMRYLCDPRQRRITEQLIWEDVLIKFAEHEDIDYAYPTTRFYSNYIEGKSGTKPEKGSEM